MGVVISVMVVDLTGCPLASAAMPVQPLAVGLIQPPVMSVEPSGAAPVEWSLAPSVQSSAVRPPRPRNRAPTPRDLIEVSDFLGVQISPDGRYVAFQLATPSVGRNEVTLEWYVGSLDPLANPKRIADGGAPIWIPLYGVLALPRAQWAPDSRSLYYLALQGEQVGLWRVTLDGLVGRLTDEPGNVEDFIVDPSVHAVIFEVGAAREAIKQAELLEYRHGIRLTPQVDLEDHLFRNLPYRGRMTTIRHDARLDMDHEGMPLSIANERRVKVLNLDTGLSRAASPAESTEYMRRKVDSNHSAESSALLRKQAGATGSTAFAKIIESPSDPGRRKASRATPRVYEIGFSPNGNAGQSKICSAGACRTTDLRDLGWRPGSREIVFATQAPSGVNTLYAWNPDRDAVRTIVTTSGLLGAVGDGASRVRAALCPMNDRYAICTFSSPSVPPRLEILDLSTGDRRVWFEPNSGLKALQLARVESVAWHDRWGRPAHGVLVLPTGFNARRPWPLVITGYLCDGFLRGGIGRDVPEFVLAAAGIAALCVNLDMNGIWGQPYPSGRVPKGQQANLQSTLDEWESAVDFLRARGDIDGRRVGISGLSFGAQAVHFASFHSRRFAVAAACSPDIQDPFDYYIFSTKGAAGLETLSYYRMRPPEQDSLHLYSVISPARNVGKIRLPILIQTSERESRYGIQYYAAMMARQKPMDVYVFPDEQHNFTQPVHREEWNARFVDWFRFWLLGEQDDQESKQDQYARWRGWSAHLSRSE